MTTPFEFGAGTQVGDSFEQDQDGLARFELRIYNDNVDIGSGSGGTGDIAWTHMVGDGVRPSLVDTVTRTTLSPPTPGLYLMVFNLEAVAATGSTITTIKLISSLGRQYCLFKGTLTTTSTYINSSVLVPVSVSSGVIETFKVQVVASSQDVSIVYGSATNGNSFWQLIQMPVAQVENVIQVLPDSGV